ncbi:hypothetical protein REPUB_Repub13aG0056700 [Reevesia pubescens]
MGCAFRQVEATKVEFDVVLKQKKESILLAQKMSMEITKMCKDLEQKDKIFSAMLRKSKLDTAEKQLLLKEVKVSKAKKKQAELETERWRVVSEFKHEIHSLKELKIDLEVFSPLLDCQSLEMNEDLEQMRLKDEKLEAFYWRLLSMELESKQLQSYTEGLNQDVSQLRQDNMKMKALLLEREKELDSLMEQFVSQLKPLSCQKTNLLNFSLHDPSLTRDSFWPKVKIIKKKSTKNGAKNKNNFAR